MNTNAYVQYGCGLSAPAGWRHFDASPTLRFERLPLVGRMYTRNRVRFPDNVEYGDIVRGLPVAAGSCRAVYCSHVLEHLALEELRVALRNTRALLQDGGCFRFVLPDLEYSARQYLQSAAPDAALTFMHETSLGLERRQRGWGGLLAFWFSNARHLWMWDYKAMERELRDAGFSEIRRAAFGDGADPAFAAVENPARWQGSFGVDCRR